MKFFSAHCSRGGDRFKSLGRNRVRAKMLKLCLLLQCQMQDIDNENSGKPWCKVSVIPYHAKILPDRDLATKKVLVV